MITIKNAFPKMAKAMSNKHNDITPDFLSIRAQKEVVLREPYMRPDTGEKGVFESKVRVNEYVAQHNLAKTHPTIAAEWNKEKNADLRPTDVSAECTMPVWWIKPVVRDGIDKYEIWQEPIANRCCAKSLPSIPNVTSLAEAYPDLAATFHTTKNGALTPKNVPANSKAYYYWKVTDIDELTGRGTTREIYATIQDRLGIQKPQKAKHEIADPIVQSNPAKQLPTLPKKAVSKNTPSKKDASKKDNTLHLEYKASDVRVLLQHKDQFVKSKIDLLENYDDGALMKTIIKKYYYTSKKISQDDLADALGLSFSVFYRHLNKAIYLLAVEMNKTAASKVSSEKNEKQVVRKKETADSIGNTSYKNEACPKNNTDSYDTKSVVELLKKAGADKTSDEYKLVCSALDMITDRQKKAIQMFFLNNEQITSSEAGKKLGINNMSFSQLKARGIKGLASALNNKKDRKKEEPLKKVILPCVDPKTGKEMKVEFVGTFTVVA